MILGAWVPGCVTLGKLLNYSVSVSASVRIIVGTTLEGLAELTLL